MAVPTGYWSLYGVGLPPNIAGATGSAIGTRENLMDPIVILDPTDTPTLNMLPKEDVSAPYAEWLLDKLEATNTNVWNEGADFSTATATSVSGSYLATGIARTRIANVAQINRVDFVVTRSMIQASQRGMAAGVRNEYQYQLFKHVKELMRNIDATLVASGSAVGASATASPRRTANIRGLLDPAANPAPSTAVQAVSIQVSGVFATASFAKLHQTMDSVGADPDTLFVSSGVKADISNLILNVPGTFGATGAQLVRRVNQDQVDREWTSIIDIIEDDFGKIMVVRDRWIPSATATAATANIGSNAYFLVDRSKLKVSFYQRPDHFPLPPNGDAQRGFVLAEWMFKCLHPSAVGIGYNVSNN